MPEIVAGRSGLRPQRPPLTPLAQLLAPEPVPEGAAGVVVSGITLDSRLVQPGDLYVALPGASRHGAEFVADAVAAGAVAVLTDDAGRALVEQPGGSRDVPLIVQPDPRSGLGALAARVYGHPSRGRLVFGITGTNGKTTTGHLLAAALRGAGLRTGVVGTLGFSLDGEPLTGPRTTITTPEAPDLQALLAVLAELGAEALVMEVSSHALALGRADGIVFDVAAFTNLGRDHLDFHGDLESYFEAKSKLFTAERARRVVLNVDDPRGRELQRRIGTSLPVVTVGLGDAPADEAAADAAAVDAAAVDEAAAGVAAAADAPLHPDYVLLRAERDPSGAAVSARTPRGELEFRLGLPGDFNIRNALTALAMADQAGVDLAAAARGLAGAAVPGRMEPVVLDPPGPSVVVDFAHTPQAVASVLAALAGRRRVVVLGSGGDRDPRKREPMGAAAVAGAEVVVVTDDNPRSEDPAAIRAAVLRGAEAEQRRQRAAGRVVEVVDGGDRRRAIRQAIGLAGPDDVVAVLGKGHETGQEIAGAIHPFDDRDVIAALWAELTATSESPVPS